MAETQTFSYQPETTTETNLDQLTPDEQDSLAVGESIAEKEEQVYAGKYKSAEELQGILNRFFYNFCCRSCFFLITK